MRTIIAAIPLGLAIFGLALSVPATAHDRFHILHTFLDEGDGGTSNAPVIMDRKGNVYGTALQGGANNDGVIFKITPKGELSTLYSFAGGNDGDKPEAGLVMDASGNFYGTTNLGGPSDQGTAFKLAPDGTETVLHAFTGGSDGGYPQASLILDKAGNLYGTTVSGGRGCSDGCGTIFRIAPDGSFTTLYAFTGGNDGWFIMSGLLADEKGNLYGTAQVGGAHGFGAVFRLSRTGALKVLYAFQGGYDGAYSQAGLIRDASGNLYGTTRGGGGGSACGDEGCGTIFKLAPDGTETVLYAFKGGSDGGEPYGGVTADSVGNLYGTTITGGDVGFGVVFELRSGGTLKSLHIFQGASDGAWPEAGVALDGSGNVYGTAYAEGPDGWGTVFKIRP
ncbi:MAG TPA: choice-of-anchor tandem repeat GloVer-containing protein [Rhizomicrobium sp.]|nr:choice-of-anchor tandem repeat GloVer-containing protein [Rhizomicrobium sp.]